VLACRFDSFLSSLSIFSPRFSFILLSYYWHDFPKPVLFVDQLRFSGTFFDFYFGFFSVSPSPFFFSFILSEPTVIFRGFAPSSFFNLFLSLFLSLEMRCFDGSE